MAVFDRCTTIMLVVWVSLMAASCGGGSNTSTVTESSNLEDNIPPSDYPIVAQSPNDNTLTINSDLNPVINGPIPNPLNQSLYCEIDAFTYTLVLRGDSSALYSDNDGGSLAGNYEIAQQGLILLCRYPDLTNERQQHGQRGSVMAIA